MNQRETRPVTVVELEVSTPSAAAVSPAIQSKPSSPTTLLGKTLGRQPQSSGEETAGSSSLDEFLSTSDPVRQIELWFGEATLRRESLSRDWVIQQLQRDIARIDACVSSQLNSVLHHPTFQKLEASWRGLAYLAECRSRWSNASIKVKVLNTSWSELRSDFENANEFDQSDFFKKVYEHGIGLSGEHPFSAMLLDFAIHPRPSREHPCDDIEILSRLSEVGQAAFCPMIANAHPSLFDEERFSDLRPPGSVRDVDRKEQDHYERLHESPSFFRWKKFRSDESARFMSLALPRMLMRRPYRAGSTRYFGFGFDEVVKTTDDYCWGGAAFGVGEVLLRAYAEGSWLADIRGAQRGRESGGLVLGPTYDAFSTEPRDTATKPVTEMVISDDFERSLSRLGFMPLCACKDMPFAAFYSSNTIQKPVAYYDNEATANARISTMLNFMLCASRFAHYIKWITRDKIGGCNSPEALEYLLQNWLAGYICDADADSSIRAEKPLRDAQIKINAVPGSPGEYKSVLHLMPHFGFEEVSALVVLKDEKLVKKQT